LFVAEFLTQNTVKTIHFIFTIRKESKESQSSAFKTAS